jgi:putative redox protein
MIGRSEKVEFSGAHGGLLAGRLDLPMGRPRAFALFAHCFTCSKDIFAASRVSQGLAEHGIAVLRFDFTGLGASEGEFANTNFSSNVDDLAAAAAFLREHYAAPTLLVGHSLGGAAVLKAAGSVPEARAVATIGAPSDPEHVKQNFDAHLDEIETNGEAEVSLAGRPFRIKKQFLEDIAAQSLHDAVAGMRKALLVMHSPLDETVSIDNASAIFLAAKHPKSFVSLDHADHLLTRRADAMYAAEVLAAWASRFLPAVDSNDLRNAPPGEVTVREAGEGTFPNLVAAGRHSLRADEPEKVGGTDTGPDPYSFLLTSLGACTSMTIRMYADRKGYPLERAEVRLKHSKVHATDCAECETPTGKVDLIEREIELLGDLSDEQRADLLRIADRCPVHRTLHSEIHVATKLAG